MDMTGERRIPASRQIVWEALNNPEVLKASIPGCESLEKLDDDKLKATAAVKVGPISARFTGNVQLTDINPPNSYRISGEGQGGVAGFAKGGANVALADDGSDTLLSYQVNAQVGGKLAQLGGRLIDATAKQMADAFFDRFSKQVQAMSPVTAEAASPASRQTPSPPSEQTTSSPSARTAAPASGQVTSPASGQTTTLAAGKVTSPPPSQTPPPPAQPSQVAPRPATPPASGQGRPETAGRPLSPEAAESAAGDTMAEPIAAVMHSTPPPAAVSLWSMIPHEPFGLPMAAWIGSGVFIVIMLLMLGSML